MLEKFSFPTSLLNVKYLQILQLFLIGHYFVSSTQVPSFRHDFFFQIIKQWEIVTWLSMKKDKKPMVRFTLHYYLLERNLLSLLRVKFPGIILHFNSSTLKILGWGCTLLNYLIIPGSRVGQVEGGGQYRLMLRSTSSGIRPSGFKSFPTIYSYMILSITLCLLPSL